MKNLSFILLNILILLSLTNALSKKSNKNLIDTKQKDKADNPNGQGHGHSNSIKTLLVQSKKLFKRMQAQNDLYTENLAECHQKLAKYTRLMVVNSNHIQSNESVDISILNGFDTKKLENNFKFQASFILQRELNYYLFVF